MEAGQATEAEKYGLLLYTLCCQCLCACVIVVRFTAVAEQVGRLLPFYGVLLLPAVVYGLLLMVGACVEVDVWAGDCPGCTLLSLGLGGRCVQMGCVARACTALVQAADKQQVACQQFVLSRCGCVSSMLSS